METEQKTTSENHDMNPVEDKRIKANQSDSKKAM